MNTEAENICIYINKYYIKSRFQSGTLGLKAALVGKWRQKESSRLEVNVASSRRNFIYLEGNGFHHCDEA